MSVLVKGTPTKIASGSVTLPNNDPVKLVDARPTRKKLLITCSAIHVGLGDAGVTQFNGTHLIPHLNQFELETSDEIWCVVRQGKTLGQVISFMEFYD